MVIERLIRSRYPILLLIAASIVGRLYVLPFRSIALSRSDGQTILVPNPDSTGSNWDAWDYLQQARRLAEGHGFTSRFTYPPFLPESLDAAAARDEAFPVLWRQPAYPLVMAGVFRLLGRFDPTAMLLVQALAVLLLPIAAFAFGRRVLTDGWAASAALWTLLTPAVIGFHEPLVATTLFVLAVCMVWWAAARPDAFTVAVLLAVAYYVRAEAVFLLPAVLVCRRRLGASTPNLAVTTVVFAALVAPWLVRSALLTGHATYNGASLLFHDVDPFPGWLASRTLDVRAWSTWSFVTQHAGAVVTKTVGNGARFARDVCLFPVPGLLPLAVLALRSRGASIAWVWGALVLPIVTFLILSPMEYAPRFVAASVPGLAVCAALVLATWGRRGKWIAAGVSVVCAFTTAMFVVTRPAGDPESIAEVASLDADRLRNHITLSNVPTVVSWVWDRPAVWAPPMRDVRWLAERRNVVAVFTCGAGRTELDTAFLDSYVREGGGTQSAGCPSVVTFDEGGRAETR